MEVDSESIPTIVCEPAPPPTTTDLLSLDKMMDPKFLINNHKVLLEEDDESFTTTESVAAGPSMKSEDDQVKSDEVTVAVESDSMETCREGVTLSAIVNHVTTDGDVVVMSDNLRTEQKVCPYRDLDFEMKPTDEDVTMKPVPSSPVVPELIISSTSSTHSTHSSISLTVHQVTDPSSPLSPSLELPAASPTVHQSHQPELQQELTNPLLAENNDEPVVSIIPVSEEKTQRTEQALISSIVKPKCEVEDAINDVKRDDFFTGNDLD
jgi:hypothetical protein